MADKKRIVVLSGSGISAESGLSTFRGGNGLWDNVPVEEVCSAQAWRHHPEKVQEFFNVRRAQLRDVEPNDAHKILAQMEEDFDVDVVTQNVDNLHERAGSSKVLHLHGELTKVRPEDCCCERDGFSTEYVMDIGYRRVEMGEVGGPGKTQLRPHIVFFGEAVPNLEAAAALVARANVLLIVGTSMQVYPAASLYRFAPSDCGIYVIDPDPSAAASIRGVHIIKDKATSGMRQFRDILSEESAFYPHSPQSGSTADARFCYLFLNAQLRTAPELPATTLADWCYDTVPEIAFAGHTRPQYRGK